MLSPSHHVFVRRPLVAALVCVATGFFGACDDDVIQSLVVSLDGAPASINFGEVPVGAADERVVVVSNRGNAPWVPEGAPDVDGAGFAWVSGCDEPVGAGDVCEATVRFAPAAEGDLVGGVSFFARGVGEGGADITIDVPLAGVGAPPVLLLSPERIDFGDVLVGDFARRDVVVENVGPERIDVTLRVNDGAFLVDGVSAKDVQVNPGSSLEVTITFSPRLGGPIEGALQAEVCGSGCGPTVALDGVGAAPEIHADPRAVDFGFVGVGQVQTRRIAITNVGAGVLVLNALELFAPSDELSVRVDADLPTALRDGDVVEAVLTYAPTVGRQGLDAALVLHSTDPLSPEALIPIDGQVLGPGLQLLPEAVHFGRLADGASRELTLLVRSVGTAAVTDLAVSVDGVGFVLAQTPSSAPLEPQQAMQLSVRATALASVVAAGGGTGTITVSGAGTTATANLAMLAGSTGCVPLALIAHANLGAVPLRSGATGAVVVENAGDAPCVLRDFDIGGAGLAFDADFAAAPQGLNELGIGQSGQVQFAFSASRTGPQSIVVGLHFDDVAAPVFVSASATGFDGSLGVVPPTLTLGPIPAACPDPTAGSAVVNTGATTLEVTTITIDPPNAPLTAALGLPFVLQPGASRALTVTGDLGRAPLGTSTARLTFSTDLGISATLTANLEVAAEAELVEERFTVSPALAVDILFIVDDSGSMGDDQQQLAENFATFFEEGLEGGAPDFHVGVTTTDVLSAGSAAGRLVGQPTVLTPTTPALADRFAQNVLVGIDGAGIELGLEAMRLVFERPENTGFLRRDAALSIVIISDEEDAGAFPEILPDAALARSPEEYIALLEGLKAGTLSRTPILVSAVVNPRDSARYRAVANHFGGSTLDITTPDWGERLSEIGNDTFSLARSFQLNGSPVPGTVAVEVDGTPTTNFVVDVARGTVTLTDVPTAGADVSIVYRTGCE